MFNIDEFSSVINKRWGVQKTNRFSVQILPPQRFNNINGATSLFRDLELLADQVNFPGVSLTTHDVRRYGYGPVEKRANGHNFTELNVSFIKTGDGYVHRAFKEWISIVSPFNMRQGISGQFTFSYKTDYITDIRIKLLTESNELPPAAELVLREAYPIAIQDLPVSWGEMNNHARLSVNFAFQDWYLEDI